MEFEKLETERLILRKLTQSSYDYIFKELNDSEIILFLGLKSTEELTQEKAKYTEGLSTCNRHFLNFQLIEKKANAIIGACGFHAWSIDHKRAEIGYGIFEDTNKKQGFMTEAIIPIIQYGFNEMNLVRIEAFLGTKNPASKGLLEKLNFTKEGLLRQHYCQNNVMEDSLVYGLLKTDYNQY